MAKFKKGDKCHWSHDPATPLVYLGKEGAWHQFEKAGAPGVVWCEVLDEDLRLLEATPGLPYREQMASDFAQRIKALGFKVYLAREGRGSYGFITDESESRVLSFQFDLTGRLSGNYEPPSTASGTGWVLDKRPEDLLTAEDVKQVLYASVPAFAGKGWSSMSTVKSYLKMYVSSNFKEVL